MLLNNMLCLLFSHCVWWLLISYLKFSGFACSFIRFVKGAKPGYQTGFDIDEADISELEQFHEVIVASAIFGNFSWSNYGGFLVYCYCLPSSSIHLFQGTMISYSSPKTLVNWQGRLFLSICLLMKRQKHILGIPVCWTTVWRLDCGELLLCATFLMLMQDAMGRSVYFSPNHVISFTWSKLCFPLSPSSISLCVLIGFKCLFHGNCRGYQILHKCWQSIAKEAAR